MEKKENLRESRISSARENAEPSIMYIINGSILKMGCWGSQEVWDRELGAKKRDTWLSVVILGRFHHITPPLTTKPYFITNMYIILIPIQYTSREETTYGATSEWK